MTILVLLVLVMLWVAVLTPMAVRRVRRGQTDGAGSIDSFHQQLHLLERAGPKLVPPAHRLETRWPANSARRADLVLVGATGAAALGPACRPQPAAERADGDRRRRVRRRRRDVLLALVVTTVLTGAVGALPGLRMLWILAVLCVVAIAGYVALAAYAQLIEADRQVYRPAMVNQSAGPLQAFHPAGDAAADVSQLGPAVVALGARIAATARAGYPGAWDEEPDGALAPHRAAAGR